MLQLSTPNWPNNKAQLYALLISQINHTSDKLYAKSITHLALRSVAKRKIESFQTKGTQAGLHKVSAGITYTGYIQVIFPREQVKT